MKGKLLPSKRLTHFKPGGGGHSLVMGYWGVPLDGVAFHDSTDYNGVAFSNIFNSY